VEQFGRIAVEAMLAEAVVVASTTLTVLGDAGVLAPEDDVEAPAAVLGRLVGDVAGRAELRC
jgi:hypothetical protein